MTRGVSFGCKFLGCKFPGVNLGIEAFRGFRGWVLDEGLREFPENFRRSQIPNISADLVSSDFGFRPRDWRTIFSGPCGGYYQY